MSITENVVHGFDLTGMVAGEWFMGCTHCHQQYPKNAIGFSTCSNCAKPMGLFNVTEDDMREREEQAEHAKSDLTPDP